MTRTLTVAMDDELYEQARRYADQRGIPLDELVREYLAQTVGETERNKQAARRFREHVARLQKDRGSRTWTREEINDRAAMREEHRRALEQKQRREQ